MGRVKLSNKLARELLKYAEDRGFEWDGRLTGGGHIKLRHPNGGVVLLAATPGRKNNGHNSRKDIERVARDGHSI
jgi:hypothetical protein